MGLGLISGIGLFILTFVFGLEPGKPPIDVMLTILAVIACASVLQTAGGLNVMMKVAERLTSPSCVYHPFSTDHDVDINRVVWYWSCSLYYVSNYL